MDRPVMRALPLALALALAAPVSAGAEARPQVAAVELRVPPGDEASAAPLIAIAPGDRLTDRALRRTVQRLYHTGRYRNVRVRAAPAPGPGGAPGEWVILTVEALPIRRVDRVVLQVEGPSPLDADALRTAARVPEGEAFEEADLEAAAGRVRAALARRGHRDARVEGAIRGEARLTVELLVHPGPVTRVRAVRLAGEPGTAVADLAATLRTRPGAPLEGDALDADVRTLRAALHRAGHRRARVGAPVLRVADGAAEVEFPVFAGPHLSFAFRGNAAVPAAVLLRQLGLEEGQPVDAPALDAAADRLVAFYRARGFAGARIEVEELRRDGALAVVFRIHEGLRYRLGRIRFDGAGARDEAWLVERLLAHVEDEAEEGGTAEQDAARALLVSIPGVALPDASPPPLPARERWEETAWDRAAERIVEGYRAEGWLEALYLGSSVTLDGAARVVEVTLRLREGPLTRVESISFEGNRALSLPELAREARLAPGDPLAFERVEETRTAILRQYLARGYAFARVEAREDLDRARDVAAVRYVIDEGPQVRIGRIVVTGNRRTLPEVVRGALHVAEGGVYDAEAIARSHGSLLRLGVFRAVNVRLAEPEAPHETKDLSVELSERPYATLTQGIGYSIANGPRAVLEYTRPNLLGRAIELNARGKVNYLVEMGGLGPDLAGKEFGDRIEGRADVGVRSTRLGLLPFPAGARLDAIGEVLHRRAYDLNRVSGVLGVDAGVTSRVGFSLQYELEVDDIRRTNVVGVLTQADLERLRFDEGVTTLQVVRPSFSLDFRDNSAHPRRGWFAAGALEYARSLGSRDARALFGLLPGSGIHTNMVKLSGTLSGYLPFGRASVLALSLRGGRVYPLDETSRTIIPRRFFLGGASTMRGYSEEEMIQQDVRGALADEARLCATSATGAGCTERGRRIAAGLLPVSEGGEAFLLVKSEVRLALTSAIEAGFFVDVGNLWLDPERYRLLDLRANAGFGIRFVTPVGPAALDFGFNVTPDARINERRFAPHFTIGLF